MPEEQNGKLARWQSIQYVVCLHEDGDELNDTRRRKEDVRKSKTYRDRSKCRNFTQGCQQAQQSPSKTKFKIGMLAGHDL